MNPQWIDLQVNGYGGVNYSSPTLTTEDFARSAWAIVESGTLQFLPTIITSPIELYERNMAIIHEAIGRYNLHNHIPGVHFEGPFISPEPGAVGCHNPAYVQKPNTTLLDKFPFIKMITVAAERPGVLDIIRDAASRGIIVSLGHQLASYEELCAAADAGAQCLTHFGNGIPNEINRHKNPLWSGMACDALTALLITDGHHLPPEVIDVIIAAKGVDKIIVTSDMSPPAGCPPGNYSIFGNDAVLEPNGKLHNTAKNCLCGSASTMSACMDYLASLNLLSPAELTHVGRTNAQKLLAH